MKGMKGITPIIAIIVLLLITVALAGVAWSYLQGYMGGLTAKSIEVRDYFCLTGNIPVLVIANIGTEYIRTNEITMIDAGTGNMISGGTWTSMNGTAITQISVSGVGRWTSGSACVGTCSYRVTSGSSARTQRVSVTC